MSVRQWRPKAVVAITAWKLHGLENYNPSYPWTKVRGMPAFKYGLILPEKTGHPYALGLTVSYLLPHYRIVWRVSLYCRLPGDKFRLKCDLG